MATQVADVIRKIYQEQLTAPRYTARKWENVCTILGVFLAALFLAGAVYYWNNFIVEYTLINEDVAQIKKEMDRRKNLIPNLISSVKNYSIYEGKVFKHTSDVRSGLSAAKNLQGELERFSKRGDFNQIFSKFMAIVEQYPDLKAETTYQDLMTNLTNCEDRIAAGWEKFNTDANKYNTTVTKFPAVMYAILFRFKKFPLYNGDETDKKSLPIVDEFGV
ncbi:MAG: LemA family protein [Elusimicrobia bacterium]|nr:LemA family protein [Candidatus Liberimonas magnetica]